MEYYMKKWVCIKNALFALTLILLESADYISSSSSYDNGETMAFYISTAVFLLFVSFISIITYKLCIATLWKPVFIINPKSIIFSPLRINTYWENVTKCIICINNKSNIVYIRLIQDKWYLSYFNYGYVYNSNSFKDNVLSNIPNNTPLVIKKANTISTMLVWIFS